MKELSIKLSDKKVLIDDNDYIRCLLYKWHFDGGGGIVKTTRPCVKLANFIMNNYENMYDHIDRNPLNNQKNNLRITSHQQNMCNKAKPNRFMPCTSKYKGVFYREDRKCWCARIQHNRKTIFLGHFSLEENAARAYDEAAKRLHGEFAVLNFPQEPT